MVSDGGLSKLCGLSSLKSLNLDAYQISDIGLSNLTSTCFYYKNRIQTNGLSISV